MPPTSEAAQLSFFCESCLETTSGVAAVIINSDHFCQECFDLGLRPQFESHLRNEYAPVEWMGGVNFACVRHQFPASFVTRYEQRLLFYAIPSSERLHCAAPDCEQFLGRPSDHNGNVTCSRCSGTTCSHCSTHISNAALGNHTCTSAADRLLERFGGQIRGQDYQLCPGCNVPVAIWDGCNDMSCPCGTDFCYVCGEEAYQRDVLCGCPHYNGHPPVAAPPTAAMAAPPLFRRRLLRLLSWPLRRLL